MQLKKAVTVFLLTSVGLILSFGITAAQDTPPMRSKGVAETFPRFTIGGRGISTFKYDYLNEDGGGSDDDNSIDFADTSLLFMVDEELYSKLHGGFLVGFKLPDKDVDVDELEPVFFSQVNAFLDGERWGFRIGRSRLHNKLITFPTIRDDDQLEYVYIQNANADSDISEFQQYGDELKADLYFMDSKLRFSAFADHMFITEDNGDSSDSIKIKNDFKLNAGGAALVYDLPPPLRYNRYLRTLGLSYFAQKIDDSDDDWINSFILGSVVNLTRYPIHFWDLRLQGIYSDGDGTESVASPREAARSSYYSAVGSLRYLHQPLQIPRMQLALTAGWKDYIDVDASRFSIIPSFVYRLGNNFDFLAQYEYEKYFDDMQAATGAQNKHTFWIGLSMNFEVVFNDYIGERTEILNVLHGYIP